MAAVSDPLISSPIVRMVVLLGSEADETVRFTAEEWRRRHSPSLRVPASAPDARIDSSTEALQPLG